MTTPDRTAVVEESERVVLGAALLDPDVAEALIRDLPTAMYQRPEHAMIAQAIRDVWENRGAVDTTLVVAELTAQGRLAVVGGASYLSDLLDAAQLATTRDGELRLDPHVENVRRAHGLRRLGEAAVALQRAAEAGDRDAVREAPDACEKLPGSARQKLTTERRSTCGWEAGVVEVLDLARNALSLDPDRCATGRGGNPVRRWRAPNGRGGEQGPGTSVGLEPARRDGRGRLRKPPRTPASRVRSPGGACEVHEADEASAGRRSTLRTGWDTK